MADDASPPVSPRVIDLAGEAATLALGARIARIAPRLRLVFLSGALGAGKTTLVRGLLRALGWSGLVKSPTYTLVEHYVVSRLDLYHFDLYRFTDKTEWLSSGFDETLETDALSIIEWPERALGLLPSPDLHIHLELHGASRRARLEARSAAVQDYVDELTGERY